MAISDANKIRLNKMNRAAQDATLGTVIQDLQNYTMPEVEDLMEQLGDVADLDTTATNLVDAVNEVNSNADDANAAIGTIGDLDTTATDLVEAVNEVKVTADAAAEDIGDITTLDTTDKSDVVSAINEVNTNADANTAKLVSYVKLFHADAADAVAASTTGVLAAVTDTGVEQIITEGITNPAIPRNINATAGGTEGDIKAIQVVIVGTNIDDEVITETLPAFTVDTAGSVAGSKAFKTVTSITIPAHDGNGATTVIGFGDKLGIPDTLSRNTILSAFLGNVKEGTLPAVAVNSADVESNTIALDSALDGIDVDVYYIIG